VYADADDDADDDAADDAVGAVTAASSPSSITSAFFSCKVVVTGPLLVVPRSRRPDLVVVIQFLFDRSGCSGNDAQPCVLWKLPW
jgi:hypothetical protein